MRLQELESLDEKRLVARQNFELHLVSMAGSFDKKVRHKDFKKGDIVLAIRRPMILISKSKGKFKPKWEGLFVIDKVYSNRAYIVLTKERDKYIMSIYGKLSK